jgi:hypothetical protein
VSQVTQLLEMFPDWKHDDMEALLSSCGDKVVAVKGLLVRRPRRWCVG